MFGEDVGRGPEDNDRGENQNQQRQHDERVGAREGKADNPHPGLIHPMTCLELLDTGVSKLVNI